MPNRIIREGILTSPRIAKLAWPEEVFYRRLHSVVDDFGRYYADLGLLRAGCYPRQLTKVSDSDIGKWLCACEAAALVRVYPAQDGESYLEVLNFGQQVRAKKSKFPDPLSTCAADATQPPTDAHLGVSVSVSGDVSEDEGVTRGRRAATPAIQGIPDPLLADYMAVRKAKRAGPLTDTAIAGLQREATNAGISLEQAVTACVEFGWQGFNATWYADRKKPAGRGAVVSTPASDPDSREAVEAEARAKGIADWDGIEQFHLYKARVRGPKQPGLSLDALAGMAQQRQGVH